MSEELKAAALTVAASIVEFEPGDTQADKVKKITTTAMQLVQMMNAKEARLAKAAEAA